MAFFDTGDHIRLSTNLSSTTGPETLRLLKDQYEGRTFHVVKTRMTVNCSCGGGSGSAHSNSCTVRCSLHNPQRLEVREITSELNSEFFEHVSNETFDSAPPPAAA